MSALSWLVVHGAAVWRVALVALIASGALVEPWLRQRAARAAARREPILDGRSYRLPPAPRPSDPPARRSVGRIARAMMTGALVGAGIFALYFLGLAAVIPAEMLVEVRAATPLRRAGAVAEYAELIEESIDDEEDPGRRAALVEQVVSLRVGEGQCVEALAFLAGHEQWEAVLDLGTRCDALPEVARAAFELGELERARAAAHAAAMRHPDIQSLTVEAQIALVQGDLAAAEAGLRSAAALPGGGRLACVVDAIAHARGDAGALARLSSYADPLCAWLEADAGRALERRWGTDPLPEGSAKVRLDHLTNLGRWRERLEVAPLRALTRPLASLPWGSDLDLLDTLAGVETPSETQLELRPALESRFAVIASATGRPEEAGKLLDRAEVDARALAKRFSPFDPDTGQPAAWLDGVKVEGSPILVEHAGTPGVRIDAWRADLARSRFWDWELARAPKRAAALRVAIRLRAGERPDPLPVPAEIPNDEADVLRALAERRTSMIEIIAPGARRDLLRWAKIQPPPRPSLRWSLDRAATRLALAEAQDDAEIAGQERRRIEVFRAVLARRAVLASLAVLDEMSP